MNKRYLVLENGSIYEAKALAPRKVLRENWCLQPVWRAIKKRLPISLVWAKWFVFTYPLIGNYGINDADYESDKPAASAIITADMSEASK